MFIFFSNIIYILIKIVFFGSESSGKTSLASQISKKFEILCCPEYVREYLALRNLAPNRKNIISTYNDILPMAVGQAALEKSFENYSLQTNKNLLIYDTNIETNWIYSKFYYKKTPIILDKLVTEQKYDFYFLMYPDIAWIADGLRDSPNNREAMHNLFKNYLIKNNRNFVEIRGNYESRFEQVYDIVKAKLFTVLLPMVLHGNFSNSKTKLCLLTLKDMALQTCHSY